MTFTIHKGKHRPRRWWMCLALWYHKTIMRRKVSFRDGVYNLYSPDQDDTNKLFGIGYLWNHHQESARVGWRFDIKKNKFILSAYCYIQGQRIMRNIAECYANVELLVVIRVNPTFYEFSVYQYKNNYPLGCISIPYFHKKKWSYQLGLFFGGNKPAPANLKIQIQKV